MLRIQHNGRRHRLAGLLFFAVLAAVLMVFFLDGAGIRAWRQSLPPGEQPFEVIELKRAAKSGKKPAAAPTAKDKAKKPRTAKPLAMPASKSSAEAPPAARSAPLPEPASLPTEALTTPAGPKASPPSDLESPRATAQPQGQGAADSLAPAATPASPADAKPGRWRIQVASYSQEGNAIKLKERLQPEFGSVYIQSAKIGEQNYYRVRIGPLPSRERALEISERLRGFGIDQAQIDSIPEPAVP